MAMVLPVLVTGCASQHRKDSRSDDGCCGLTAAQLKYYYKKAIDSVVSPAAWKAQGQPMPKGVKPAALTGLMSSTNSRDEVTPPTHVSVDVPIGNSVKDCNYVEVEFSHPSGKIIGMRATFLIIN